MSIFEMFISLSTPRIGLFNTPLSCKFAKIVNTHKKAFYNGVLVDTIIAKSAYLWAFVD